MSIPSRYTADPEDTTHEGIPFGKRSKYTKIHSQWRQLENGGRNLTMSGEERLHYLVIHALSLCARRKEN